MAAMQWLDSEDRRLSEIEACVKAIERNLAEIDAADDADGAVAPEHPDSKALLRQALSSGAQVLRAMAG